MWPMLIATKLRPPAIRDQVVPRERLLEQLRAGSDPALTLVICPAGFGKTTLLAAWYQAETARRPVAWLTLDEADNDPVVLWSYVIEALRQVCPAVSLPAIPQLAEAACVTDVVLPRLVNELNGQGEVVLILDDFHRLSGAALDSMAWFIEHAPSGLQLVLSTRVEPTLPLASLRARGELIELRLGDLRFTPGETDEFLNGRLGLGLERQDVEALVDRTEGWPAGLYLAALSLSRDSLSRDSLSRDSLSRDALSRDALSRDALSRDALSRDSLSRDSDRHDFVTRFGASPSRYVNDFLEAEVLQAHDPPTQALMLRSSILGRLCGPLCDAVLEQQGSAVMLDELARTNLFLVPLDVSPDISPDVPSAIRAAGTVFTRSSPSCCGGSSDGVRPVSSRPCTVARTPGIAITGPPKRRSIMRSKPVSTPRRPDWSKQPGASTGTTAGTAPCWTGSGDSLTRSSLVTSGCSWWKRGYSPGPPGRSKRRGPSRRLNG